MKKEFILFCTVMIFLCMPFSNAVGETTQEQEERFKLFNAEYNSATIQQSKTTVFLEKRLFKIDSRTGETWMLIDVFKEGKDVKYWKPIKAKEDKKVQN
jgi:hypothetical protein